MSWTGWDGEGVVSRVVSRIEPYDVYIFPWKAVNIRETMAHFRLLTFLPLLLSPPSATPTTSHIRTVTRKEIVPGVYGDVNVTLVDNVGSARISFPDNHRYTSTSLRTMIATLTEIADALDGQ